MIKIVSGYSYPSGATLALVNLCNQFNSRGYASILYGPDNWHIDKCISGKLVDFIPEAGDIIIVNDTAQWHLGDLSNINTLAKENKRKQFLQALMGTAEKFLPSIRSSSYKLVLTCQGDNALPSSLVRVSRFHKIHFSSNANNIFKSYSRLAYPTFAAPNFCNGLNKIECRSARTAGVIGSIKKQNNVEGAIMDALLDGMESVTLFGTIRDPEYYYDKIAPLAMKHSGKIKYAGFIDDQQKMYGSVSDVYSSINKPWSMVRHECAMTNTKLHAPDPLSTDSKMTNDQIFEIWKNELAL